MNIVELSIKRPIMVSMGLIALFIFGLASYFKLPLMLIPDVKMPTVTVQTVYAGASPEVIESQITKKIEDASSSISLVDTIVSYSLDSASVVTIQFKYSKDEDKALQEVKDKVDAIINELPGDADKPVISKMNVATMTPIMNIVLEGDMLPSELYTFATETVSNRLAQIPGVGSINISGGSEREIRVNLDRATIYERQIPLRDLGGIISCANVDLPGGNMTYDNRDIPVLLKGKFDSISTLKNLDIPTSTGVFKLHQLATVEDTSKTVRERTILLDKSKGTRNSNAILLQVIKNPSGNTVEIIKGINEILPEIKAMNGNIDFNVINEDATYVKDTVQDTLNNVYLGVFLTALVLLVFLHDWRSTIIVALSMPFSIIATFFVMERMGLGFNLMSLTGISGATGTLVANSVVVLENIYRHKNLGLNRKDASLVGTKEVMTSIIASTLTNIAVFLPIATIQSSMGSVLSQFAFTTVISTVFSIIVSFTLTPLLSSRLLMEKPRENPVGKVIDNALKTLENYYKKSLEVVLSNRRRSLILLCSVMGLFVFTIILASKIGFELMPTTDGGKIQIDIELDQGTSLEESERFFKNIENLLATHTEVQKIETILGSTSSTNKDVSVGQMFVYLVPKSDGRKSSLVLAPQYARELSTIPGATIKVNSVSEITVGGMSFGLDLYLKGEDQSTLQSYAQEIKEKLKNIEGFSNVSLSSKSGKQEVDFVPNRKMLSEDGLTVQDIAFNLRASIDGFVITKYKENNVEYDVRLTINEDIKDLEDLKNIPIVSRNGTYPLSRYAELSFQNSTNMVMRVDKMRTIEITADVLPGFSIGSLQGKAMKELKKMEMKPGYILETGGSSKMMGQTVGDLCTAFGVAILIIYMLLAGTLEDLKQPIYIISTVPLSIIGVILLVVGTGSVLNIVAMLGIIMLVGIVVNNAILILDMYNQLKRENGSVKESMVEACGAKLKAILMSNIAIVLGQLPMALGLGASGAEMRQPMGIVMIGGIVSSTLMTLYVVPALERLFSKDK